ncbi:MAG: hypothetical protein DIJKHBIC_00366 [Thermoanaerobaculia bacterium]|nr:hypothetical protein [Thermoanaerobaculia bacterium]
MSKGQTGESQMTPGDGAALEGRSRLRLRRSTILTAVAAAALSALEAAAYLRGGAFAVVASRVWLVHGAVAVGVLLVESFRSFREDGRRRNVLALAAVAALAFVSLHGIGSAERFAINHEATQEAGLGILGFAEPDFGYTRDGFINYPFRQYLLVALPSLPQGPSLLALRLGFALPLLLGGVVFQAALRRRLHSSDPSGALAALGTFFLLSSPYLLNWARAWEQTLLPISFALLALGAFLLCEEGVTAPRLTSLIWSGALLGTSYTPALAGWVLILVLVAANGAAAIRKGEREEGFLWLCSFVPIAVFGGLSFLTRGDVFKGPSSFLPWKGLLDAARVVFLGEPNPFFHAASGLLVAVWLVLVATGRAGLRHVLLAGWCVAVLAGAVLLRGYAAPGAPFALHRAMVALPVLVLGPMTALAPILGGRFRPWMAWPAALVIAATAPFAWRQVPEERRGRAIDDGILYIASSLRELRLDARNVFSVVLATSSRDYDNIADYLRYFAPGAEVTRALPVLRFPPPGEAVLALLDEEVLARQLEAEGWEMRETWLRPVNGQAARLVLACRRITGFQTTDRGGTYRSATEESVAMTGTEMPLTDLRPVEAAWELAVPRYDRGWSDLPLRVGGREVARGLGVHAPSTLTVRVPEGASSFESFVGLDDDALDCALARVGFELRDERGRLLAAAGPHDPANPMGRISAPLAGVHRLTLVTTDGGDGPDCDHAAWAEPVFLRDR